MTMKITVINISSQHRSGESAIHKAVVELLHHYSAHGFVKHGTEHALKIYPYQQELSSCDTYINVGGDISPNPYSGYITANFLNLLKQLNKSPETTFLFGYSIPDSCNGLALKLLSHQFKKNSSVAVSDQQSYKKLIGLGVKCILSYDLAFLLRPSNHAIKMAAQILNQLRISRSAVISLAEFKGQYPGGDAGFSKNIGLLCKQLEQRKYQPIVLLPAQGHKHEASRHIAQAIKQQCPKVKILDLFDYSSQIPDWELRQAIVTVSRLIITVCYQTTVLALAAGRTPFNLFYANEGADLTTRLGVPGCHVEQFDYTKSLLPIELAAQKAFDPHPITQSIRSHFINGLDAYYFNRVLENNYDLA